MSFGMDPEVFAVKKGNKTATSAHLIDMKPVNEIRDDLSGPVRVSFKKDGFAFELNSTPTHCRDYLVPSTGAAIRTFLKLHPDYDLTAKPLMKLSRESLVNAPEDVMGYGCFPDRDAYRLEEKTPDPRGYLDTNRYTGCHIHWSWNVKPAQKEMYAAMATMAADIHVGIPIVAMLGEANDYGEQARRSYYGQAGSHRVTQYSESTGFEYRVLSSAVFMTPWMFSWVIGQLRNTMSTLTTSLFSGREELDDAVKKVHAKYNLNTVQAIINNHDVAAARAFVETHDIAGSKMYKADFYRLMLNADKEGVQMPSSLSKGWGLHKIGAINNHFYIGIEGFVGGRWNGYYPDYDKFLGNAGWSFNEYDDDGPEPNFEFEAEARRRTEAFEAQRAKDRELYPGVQAINGEVGALVGCKCKQCERARGRVVN